ncbi:MAG: hypothetical protein HY686_06450 [Chloroflexi bacterium]|nr:hypothetical protein [Chloroflexota bacterium]
MRPSPHARGWGGDDYYIATIQPPVVAQAVEAHAFRGLGVTVSWMDAPGRSAGVAKVLDGPRQEADNMQQENPS